MKRSPYSLSNLANEERDDEQEEHDRRDGYVGPVPLNCKRCNGNNHARHRRGDQEKQTGDNNGLPFRMSEAVDEPSEVEREQGIRLDHSPQIGRRTARRTVIARAEEANERSGHDQNEAAEDTPAQDVADDDFDPVVEAGVGR